jgi:hypothetical protein
VSSFQEVVLRLLAAGPEGRLPALTREELFALGDRPVLAHGGDLAWWTGLDAPTRQVVVDTAQRGLVARRLLVGGDPPGPALVAAEEVQVVLRARREPSWIMVLGEPAQSGRPSDGDPSDEGQARGPGYQVALTGIDLGSSPGAAVLISARVEGIYVNRLATPVVAFDEAVEWLLRPVPAELVRVGRTVEVLPPRLDDERPGQGVRAMVLRAGQDWAWSRVDPQGSAGAAQPPVPAAVRSFLVAAVSDLTSGDVQ